MFRPEKKPSCRLVSIVALSAIAIAFAALSGPGVAEDAPAFGGPDDVAFAKKLWKAMKGYEDWKLTTGYYPGASPHGRLVRLYSSHVRVGKRSYPVIVKDNFAGRGLTAESVAVDRESYLRSITVMLRREEGYDAEHDDWFWVHFRPDGAIESADNGALAAGRVARGSSKGCLACHAQADGDDLLFSNDE